MRLWGSLLRCMIIGRCLMQCMIGSGRVKCALLVRLLLGCMWLACRSSSFGHDTLGKSRRSSSKECSFQKISFQCFYQAIFLPFFSRSCLRPCFAALSGFSATMVVAAVFNAWQHDILSRTFSLHKCRSITPLEVCSLLSLFAVIY